MELKINRIAVIGSVVMQMLSENENEEERAAGYIHLFGVGQTAALLAKKRGLDPELAQLCGLLHDYYVYSTGEREDHAVKGGDMILPILAKTGLFTICEMGIISKAVANHSDKEKVGDAYDELLKDADVLQHALANVSEEISSAHKERYEKLIQELGI